MFRRHGRIEVKDEQQLAVMRRAGLVVARALDAVGAAVGPGVTTAQLDAVAAEVIRAEGATASFLGYQGYPATICVSVGSEVVHGIPGSRRLRAGELVSVDCGAIVDGWHGDAARSFPVGDLPAPVARLSEATEAALWAGLAAAVVGARVGDVGAAVERAVRAAGPYGIVADYVGHGIGSAMHLEPDVPNVGPAGRGPRLRPGMALAIEPMVVLGSPRVRVLDDDWTVVTVDGSVAAHWEHTVAITDAGPWVLTAHDGGAGRLGAAALAVGTQPADD